MSTLVASSWLCAAHASQGASAEVTPPSEVTAEIARSRALYREAQAAFESGQYDLAQQRLLQAWAIRKTFDVAAALTQADLELKQYRNAAEHAEYCLRMFAPAESDATLKSVLDMYAEAKKHVGTLRVHARPDGSEISADGNTIGTAPLASPVFLEPGEHSIQIRLANAIDVRKIRVRAGGEYDVSLEVPSGTMVTPNVGSRTPPSNSDVAQPPAAKEPTPSREFAPVYWTLGIGSAVTIAGLATAFAYHARANSKQDAAAVIQARTPTCTNTSSVDCSRLSTLAAERNQANHNAQVMLLVAGATAIGTGLVSYLVWPTKTSSDSLKTSVWVTPTSAGLGFSNQF